MTAAGSWFRMHDAWFTDSKLAILLHEGHHDAVCLYFAAIAHAHAHDSDGRLEINDRRTVEILAGTESEAFDLLVTYDLVRRQGGMGKSQPTYEIAAYTRWQTTSEQRLSHAETMRKLRHVNGQAESRDEATSLTGPSRSSKTRERDEREKTSLPRARARPERDIETTIDQLADRMRTPKDDPA